MLKLTVQALVGGGMITGPDFLVALGHYNFLFASGWLFAISVVIVVVVSLLTRKPDESTISGLTYATMTEAEKTETRKSWTWGDVAGTAVVLGLVLGMYIYFSFWLK
jgi:SSS family solute:Na+ symporter